MPLGRPALSAGEIATIRRWIDEGARETITSRRSEAKVGGAARARATCDARRCLAELDGASRSLRQQVSQLSTAIENLSWLATRRSRGGRTSTSGVCCRRRKIFRRFSRTGTRTSDPRSSNGSLPTTTSTRNTGSRSGTTSCGTTKASNYYSETSSRKSISTWLLSALTTNVPYNRWVEQLLNPTTPDDPDGFLIGVNWRGEVNASQTPAMQAAQNSAQIFIGLNLKCNSCHDSFISKWKLKDAYGLASFFSEDGRLRLYRCDVPQDDYATPAFLFPELNRAPPSGSLADRRRTAAAIFTDPRNGRLPRTLVNRMWHRLLGRGFVENPDEMDGVPWSPALLDWLASDFVDGGYDLKRLHGDDRVVEGVSDARRAASRRAAARICVPRPGNQAPDGGAVRGCHRRDHRRLERVSAPGSSASAPGQRSCRAAARTVHARMANARQFAGARARPADSRPGVLDAQHDGDDDSSARTGERRTAGELAASRRPKHAGRIAALRRRLSSSRRSIRAADELATPPQARTRSCPVRCRYLRSATALADRAEREFDGCRQSRGRVGARRARRTERRDDAADRSDAARRIGAARRVTVQSCSMTRHSRRVCASRRRRGSCTTSPVVGSPGFEGSPDSKTPRDARAG